MAYQSFPQSGISRLDSVTLGGIRKRLTDDPGLRPTGFNFRSGTGAQWVGGHVVELDARASFRVTDAGIVTACLPATLDCLGWAVNQYQDLETAMRINPLTLVEQTVEYFRLLELVREYAPGIAWQTNIRATRMEEHRVCLRSGPLPTGFSDFYTEKIAQTDEWTAQIDNVGEPERDAYNALASVYALFNLDDDAIPYARDRRIDVEAIRAAR